MAKTIIRLINSVGRVVNGDPRVKDRIKVVFYPNFNIKNGQAVYAAADLSEQISTAGKEASGTGNMKFALNGALTIGTLDGANVEIREHVGPENFFLFGLTEQEVRRRKAEGYRPGDELARDPELSEVMDMIAGGVFSGGDRGAFEPVVRSLRERDEYMLFRGLPVLRRVPAARRRCLRGPDRWTRMSILNVRRMGYFLLRPRDPRVLRGYLEGRAQRGRAQGAHGVIVPFPDLEPAMSRNSNGSCGRLSQAPNGKRGTQWQRTDFPAPIS
jgi:starch phosphorylase